MKLKWRNAGKTVLEISVGMAVACQSVDVKGREEGRKERRGSREKRDKLLDSLDPNQQLGSDEKKPGKKHFISFSEDASLPMSVEISSSMKDSVFTPEFH